MIYDEPPINKPHGLKVALRGRDGEIVTVFDAEDEVDPDLFTVIVADDVRRSTPASSRAASS